MKTLIMLLCTIAVGIGSLLGLSALTGLSVLEIIGLSVITLVLIFLYDLFKYGFKF